MIRRQNNLFPRKYNITDFLIPQKELDFDSWRLYIPLDVLLVINTKCITNCIYCYADTRKRVDCTIPLERMMELIKEAKALGMRNFDISGGEIFFYKYWETLLKELFTNGFNPYISTKIPLDLDTVKRLKDLGVKTIQLSIDTIVKEEMIKILKLKKRIIFIKCLKP